MDLWINSAFLLVEGTGYTITFGDVMAGVIPVVIGILTFFIKTWFNGVNRSTEDLKAMIRENNETTNGRIDKIEEKYDEEINKLSEEVNKIEKDFPLLYVNREDYFRTMNNVEAKINNIDNKIDRLLMQTQNNKS